MSNHHVEIIMEGTVVRFDLFGTVHEDRFVAFLDRDSAMLISRQLGKAASKLPVKDFNPEDLA